MTSASQTQLGYIAALLAGFLTLGLLLRLADGVGAVSFRSNPAQLPLAGHATPLQSHSNLAAMSAASLNSSVSGWHPPNSTWITNLDEVVNGTGLHGFIFNGSQLPEGTPYGTYNWCNMPHVRATEYPKASDEYQLEYVEVIHRHHKRTPYAANTFPVESYPWSCSDEGLFYNGAPLNPTGNTSAQTYWSVYTSASNPLAPTGFNGTCQFPQITRGGLDDSWQHGRDLWGVYHDLLSFLPPDPLATNGSAVEFRVTNNVITSQVAGMLISGLLSGTPSYAAASARIPLKIQPASIDSLEPAYACPAASALLAAYGPGSAYAPWSAHLNASAALFAALDGVSVVDPASSDWHKSWDHYFDNLSSRLCHAKPLPCNASSSASGAEAAAAAVCVTAAQAAEVFRLGQLEYSFLYRGAPGGESLAYAAASYGIWVAELAQNVRDVVDGREGAVRYRHNVAHDGSVARLLALLQVDVMVWPGMGAEVVFEVYSRKGEGGGKKSYVRVLWGGRVLRSSHPDLGLMDMVDADVVLGYFDGLVGKGAVKVPGLCGLE